MGPRKSKRVDLRASNTTILGALIALALASGCSGDAPTTAEEENEIDSADDDEDDDEEDDDKGDDDQADDDDDDSPPVRSMDSGRPPSSASGDASSKDAGARPDSALGGRADAAITGVDSGGSTPSGSTCLDGTGDYTDDGPYEVKQKDVTIGSKGAYTIFYPDPLESSCPHPFVVWGNGTIITGSTPYEHFHNHAASWGIISVVSHNSSVGDGSFHTAGIDYMLEQSMDADSEFFGKVSPRAGVSGHSQGGAGATRAAPHENVKAIVNVQGSFGDPPQSEAALLCLTGTSDIQPTGCPMAVRAAKVPSMSANYDGADHVSTTLFEGTGIDQYKRLYSAWFRCFLADDQTACAMFKGGEDCPVCKEDGWAEIFSNNY